MNQIQLAFIKAKQHMPKQKAVLHQLDLSDEDQRRHDFDVADNDGLGSPHKSIAAQTGGSSLHRHIVAVKAPPSLIPRNRLFIEQEPAPVRILTKKEIRHAYR